jgi:Prenyltransferase and squalene oxidase repeat
MKPLGKIIFSSFIGLFLVIGLVCIAQTSTATAQNTSNPSQVILDGLDYLSSQQQADGGMLGFSGVSDPDTTARSVLAFMVAGKPLNTAVSADGYSMLDYLANQAITFTHDITGTLFPGRAGLLLAAAVLAGEDPSSFGGMDLASELEASYQPDTGAYSSTARQDFSSGQASDLGQAWSILGLSLSGNTVPDGAIQYLSISQGEDGSWGMGDPDTTALAVTALLATQRVVAQSDSIQKAITYFHGTQNQSGGWKPAWDTDPLNADSTGWILQALISAGEDLLGQSWIVDQTNPVDALQSLQKEDGSIGGTYANPYSTAEAIIGLSGIPLADLGVSPANQSAGLAIFYGNESFFDACVNFAGSGISGLDLLQRSGLRVETATNPTQGTAVCKIEDVGDPSTDCFGSMPNYWSYWQLGENGWEYSVVGVEQSQVMNGGVYAWTWGVGDPPPAITYQNICEGVEFVLPTATATSLPATDTPQPTSEPTSLPAALPTQSVEQIPSTQTGMGTYLLYASILLILGGLIIYLIRSHNK